MRRYKDSESQKSIDALKLVLEAVDEETMLAKQEEVLEIIKSSQR